MKIENTFLFFRDWKAENTKKDTKLLEMPNIVENVHFCLSGNFAGLNQKLTPSGNKFIINFFYKLFNNGTVFRVIHNLTIYVVILKIASIFWWRLFWFLIHFKIFMDVEFYFMSIFISAISQAISAWPRKHWLFERRIVKKVNFQQIFLKKDQNKIFQFFSINIFSKKF